jgi:hypothetical protein
LPRLKLPYLLDATEVDDFIKFWPRFLDVANQDHHYLQLSGRRLSLGGARGDEEDAIVDYVIGLESLLCSSKEPQTEMSFRLRVRGATILAESAAERRQFMKRINDLYGMRSKIVHGSKTQKAAITDMSPFAESTLRTVWRWFFDRWQNKQNSDAGVLAIDTLLGIDALQK